MPLKWDFSFSADGQSDFEKIGKSERERVFKKLEWLCASFNNINPVSLTGDHRGFLKLRVGDIRVLYKADYQKLILKVYVIDWRDKVYKR